MATQNLETAEQIPAADTPAIQSLDVWQPVTLWPHKWPTQAGWRALIFNAESRKTSRGTIVGNGLIEAGVIRRVNRRVLANPARFYAWVETQGAK
jgi:hypothetical protein